MKWTFVTCLVHTTSKLFSTWESLLFLSGIEMISLRKPENARYSLSLVPPSSHTAVKDFEDIEGKERSDRELLLFLESDIRNGYKVKFLM